MEGPKIYEEHRWLHQFLGEWVVESADEGSGTETITKAGDNWVLGISQWIGGEMGDMQSTFVLGFDDSKGRFVGSWAGSMLNMLWVYDGYLDGDKLVLECEGPNFDGSPGMSPYRDMHVFDSPTRRRLIAETKNKDGEWEQFMETVYVRP